MTKCVLWFLWKTFTRNMLKNSLTNPGTDWRPPKGPITQTVNQYDPDLDYRAVCRSTSVQQCERGIQPYLLTLEHPGVKAPGTANSTPVFPLKSSATFTLSPGVLSHTSTLGTGSPAWKFKTYMDTQSHFFLLWLDISPTSSYIEILIFHVMPFDFFNIRGM